jgi:hypothetical protein
MGQQAGRPEGGITEFALIEPRWHGKNTTMGENRNHPRPSPTPEGPGMTVA